MDLLMFRQKLLLCFIEVWLATVDYCCFWSVINRYSGTLAVRDCARFKGSFVYSAVHCRCIGCQWPVWWCKILIFSMVFLWMSWLKIERTSLWSYIAVITTTLSFCFTILRLKSYFMLCQAFPQNFWGNLEQYLHIGCFFVSKPTLSKR